MAASEDIANWVFNPMEFLGSPNPSRAASWGPKEDPPCGSLIPSVKPDAMLWEGYAPWRGHIYLDESSQPNYRQYFQTIPGLRCHLSLPKQSPRHCGTEIRHSFCSLPELLTYKRVIILYHSVWGGLLHSISDLSTPHANNRQGHTYAHTHVHLW